MADQRISLSEAARRSGVSSATLKRWAEEKVVPVRRGRRIADAEVRLFHLYVHEPMIRDAVPELEMAEEMGELAGDILPLATPLTEYLHSRYLRYFIEQ